MRISWVILHQISEGDAKGPVSRDEELEKGMRQNLGQQSVSPRGKFTQWH